MRVLFLDCDGVLNTRASRQENGQDTLDPDLVDNLNWVVQQTGCGVVISSSWRLFYSLKELRQILRRYGYTGNIIGYTPQTGGPRGMDIFQYLHEHGPFRGFAIVDDHDDMGAFTEDHLVLTDDGEGLTFERAGVLAETILEDIVA